MCLFGVIGNSLDLLIGVFALIVIVLLLVYLVESSRLVKIYKGIPAKTNKSIYGYLDKNGNLLSFSDEFYNKINISNKVANWSKKVTTIYYEGQEINYKKFLSIIKESKEIINFTIEVESKSYNIGFKKSPIFENHEICGYVLFDELYTSDQDAYLLDMMGELQTPLAYYSGKAQDINFHLNDSLKERLGVKEEKMTYNDLKRFVFEEDLEMFLVSTKELINDTRVQYRLKTINGLEYFEEVKHLKNEDTTTIISLIEVKEEKIWFESNVLMNEVEELMSHGIAFGGIILSYNSLLEEADEKRNPLALDIIKKHLKTVKKELFGEGDFITKVSDFEYILLFKDKDRLDSVINSVYNKQSILLDFEIGFAGEMINLKNKLGIAYSLDEYVSPTDFINALNSSLAFANNEDYTKDYSIHTTAVKEEVIETEEVTEYSFEKCLIDLDNSFLDDGE